MKYGILRFIPGLDYLRKRNEERRIEREFNALCEKYWSEQSMESVVRRDGFSTYSIDRSIMELREQIDQYGPFSDRITDNFVKELYQSTTTEDRKKILFKLTKSRNPRAGAPLLKMYLDGRLRYLLEPAMSAMGVLCDYQAITPLLKQVFKNNYDAHSKETILNALHSIAIREYSDDQLLEHLENDDKLIRRFFLINMRRRRIHDDRALEILSKMITDPDKNVRKEVAISLGESARAMENEIILRSLTIMLEDPEDDIKAEVLVAFGKLGDKRVSDILVKELTSRNRNVQIAAIESVGTMKLVESVDTLIDLLEDSSINDGYIKNIVIRALGNIGDHRAIPALRNCVIQTRNLRNLIDKIILQIEKQSQT